MEGVIENFRMARHHQYDRQMIIVVDEIEDKEKAASLAGKGVVWTSSAGKEIKGKISAAHGNKGRMRVIFDTGMPGQAVGSKVKIE
ncbi:50S ribosomal protein L35ae [Candidatus Woesearchaeota archaeon]|nr:50S ribosomal protein L35ae [Candidatus Woesearchaeota archaeon]